MPDVSATTAPKSDQLDNIELRQGPRIFTVVRVDVKADPNAEQPVSVHFAEFPRPWKPGVNMRRVLVHCWGKHSEGWPGRQIELFADERIKFGSETPGGTRISRISGIEKTEQAPVLLSQGRPGFYKVEPLPEADIKVAALRHEWHDADPERRKAIEAEVQALTGGAR